MKKVFKQKANIIVIDSSQIITAQFIIHEKRKEECHHVLKNYEKCV